MGEESTTAPKEIRVSIVQSDRYESLVSKYIVDSSRSTKQLAMNPWLLHYLTRTLIKNGGTDLEILDAAKDSISELRAQIHRTIMDVEAYGLELPPSAYKSDITIKPAKAKTEKKAVKPKSPPKPKVEENDDEDWEFDENDESFIQQPSLPMNLNN